MNLKFHDKKITGILTVLPSKEIFSRRNWKIITFPWPSQ